MIGAQLSGRYEITAELGHGGMGVVYLARDPLLEREVAVKVHSFATLSQDAEQRFRREAQLVAQLDHPAIVPIYDLGEHEDFLYFVMPVVRGKTLHTLNEEGSLVLGETLEIISQVAEGLDYSHRHGVVHRDMKPENVMVHREQGLRARVMDFGLALGATGSRLTKTGSMPGTMAYLSPEQVLGVDVDGQSDLYSLGTILYECLVGELPFSGPHHSLLYRIVNEEPAALGRHGIDEALECIVLSCLSKEPQERPGRGNELASLLRGYGESLDPESRARTAAHFRSRDPRAPRPAPAPLVGRARELAELKQRLDEALAGECQLVLIGGDAGMGKTRLLDELESLARVRGIRVLRGRFSGPESTFPYQGFGELVQDYYRRKATGSSSSDALDLGDLVPELGALFPALTELSALREPDGKVPPRLAAEAARRGDRTHLFELLARTLARLAGGEPIVFLLEHLHATEASIDALRYVVRRLGPTPSLFVGTYRQTEISRSHPLVRMLRSFQEEPHFSLLVLEPLSASEHRDLVISLLGSSRITAEVAERLYEVSEGNPLFTRELIRSLVDGGEVTQDTTGVWTLSGEAALATNALPETIQQIVQSRLELFPEALVRVLRTASVLGRSFKFQELQALAEVDDADDAVEQLIREGILDEDRRSRGDRLHFASGVVRDVLYGELSRRKRRALHRRHAEQLEARYADRLERIYPRLVHHFAAGDVPDKTVAYALKLAREALDAFGAEAAIRATRTALEFVAGEEIESAVEGELRLLLASGLRAEGSSEAAMKEAARAVRVLGRAGQAGAAAGASLVAAETAWQARKVGETRRWVESGIGLARSAGSRETLRKLLILGATVANLRGEYPKARACWEEAEELAAADSPRQGEEPIPQGGTLVTALPLRLTRLDPGAVPTVEEKEVLANVFETLIHSGAEGHLTPWLCEEWEGSPHGRSFRLSLRPEVRFSDGEPLTPVAVKRSLEISAARAGDRLPAAYSAIDGIDAFRSGGADEIRGIRLLGERALEFRLSEPLPIFPALLTDPSTAIRRENDERELVGTGPFRIASHDDSRILLARNPRYWRSVPPALEGIEFRTSLDASDIAAGLRSGELDLGRDLLPADLEEMLRDPRYRAGLVEATRKNVYFVALNLAGPTVQHPEVRRALCDVVRVQDIVWRTLGGFAQAATGLIPHAMLGHDPGRRRPHLGREGALDLLCSAGFVPPVKLRAAVLPLLLDRYQSLTRALLDAWAAIGVEVMIETSTLEEFLARAGDSDRTDLWIGRWAADYDDPDNFTFGLLHSGKGYLPGYLGLGEADRLLEKARRETRTAARQMLYRRFEHLLVEKRALIPLFYDVDYRIASPQIRGLRLFSHPPYVNYSEIGKQPPGEPASEATRSGRDRGIREGGTIRVPLPTALESLDPALAVSAEPAEVVPNVFETLTRVDHGARVVPCLAAEFQIAEGGRRFRFRLRNNVRFHHGRMLTVRDVRYSFERLLRTPQPLGAESPLLPIRGARAFRDGDASELAGFSILSANEFVLELEEKISFYPAMLTSPTTAVVPEAASCFTGNWRDGCAGTGPFRVVRFDPADAVELEANPHYWKRGTPKCERLVFELDLSCERIAADFRSGGLAIASHLRPAEVKALRKELDLAAGYREAPGFSTCFLALHAGRGPFSDPETRRAFRRALPVEMVVRSTLGRLGLPAHGVIPPGLLGYEPLATLAPREEAPLEARRFEGIELRAAVSLAFGGEYAPLWEELHQALRDVGISLRVASGTQSEVLRMVAGGKVDLVAIRWTAAYPDPDLFVHLLASGGVLGHFIGDPEIDRLVAQGRTETDPTLRHGIYREIEQILARDTLLVPLFHEQIYRFCRPEIQGHRLQFGWPEVAYEELALAP
ncbi:MAG: protein kinase [bacterium]|nr:protein kinase [bacterium]